MAFSLPIIVFGKWPFWQVSLIWSEFNYLYNLDRDECKLRPEELMGDRTEEKILRINRSVFRKPLQLTKYTLKLILAFIGVWPFRYEKTRPRSICCRLQLLMIVAKRRIWPCFGIMLRKNRTNLLNRSEKHRHQASKFTGNGSNWFLLHSRSTEL